MRCLRLLLAGVLPILAGGCLRAAERPPNIVVFLADDMGYGDLGCYGGRFTPTPNLDRFAAEGTRFTRFYAGAPVCSPSRAALLTGQHPARWGLHTYLDSRALNAKRGQVDFLSATAPSLPRMLHDAGYATGHFGKWHLGGGRDVHDAPGFPLFGFDAHISTWESPDPCPAITGGDWIWSPQDTVKRWDRTAFFVDQAIAFMRAHRDRPFFINVWPDDVHTPWVPDAERLAALPDGPAEERRFMGVLGEFDRQAGRLLAALAELRLDGRTIVLFTSDNGPLPTFHGRRTAGLRGSKDTLYEGGIRMPAMARWPGYIPAGRTDAASVIGFVDLLPTLCAIAGAVPPADPVGDGQDRSAAFLGCPIARRKPLFWEYGWTDAVEFPPGRSPRLAVLDGTLKLLMDAGGTQQELYDLETDPQEARNLATIRPADARRLRDEIEAWHRTLPARGGP